MRAEAFATLDTLERAWTAGRRASKALLSMAGRRKWATRSRRNLIARRKMNAGDRAAHRSARALDGRDVDGKQRRALFDDRDLRRFERGMRRSRKSKNAPVRTLKLDRIGDESSDLRVGQNDRINARKSLESGQAEPTITSRIEARVDQHASMPERVVVGISANFPRYQFSFSPN